MWICSLLRGGCIPLVSIKETVGLVVLLAKSGTTLATPWTVACQVPLPRGLPRQEYWSGLPLPGDLPDPGIKAGSPALQADSLQPTLQPPGLQHARLLCPPLSLRVCSNSCPLSRWCYLIIWSCTIPFSFCLQSFPALGSFPMSQLFPSGCQTIRVSASDLPTNIYGWFPLRWTGLISFLSKGL